MSGASATAAASLSTRAACRAMAASRSAVGDVAARCASSRFHSTSNVEMNSGRRSAAVTRMVSAMAWSTLASPMLLPLSRMLGPRVPTAPGQRRDPNRIEMQLDPHPVGAGDDARVER